MDYILTKKFDGTFTMNWIGTELSTQLRDVKTFSITPVKSITSITNFYDTIRGESTQHYFKKYFSFNNSRSGNTMSEPEPITGITGDYCSFNYLSLDLSYYRIDTDTTTTPTLSINNIVIEGTYDLQEADENTTIPDDGLIFKPKNIYKVFKLSGFELYGTNTSNLNLKFRFTQDGGRTYTPWEPLTTENIATVKLNAVRFAQVEYSVSKIYPNITSKIYDIILLGDFQNINNYYLKTNRYGVREDCAGYWTGGTSAISGLTTTGSNAVCLNGKTSYKGDSLSTANNYNRDWFTKGLSCYLTGNIYTNMNAQNSTATATSGNYDPYNTEKIGAWYSFLANSTNKILGWTVEYNLTDPDGNGIDKNLHEYQLFNTIDMQTIKIIVPENAFPDNQVVVNEFMLDMIDTFQIIILKDVFHEAFGIEKRPNQKDIIYFCRANRFFRVKHAQVHRDVMYLGIYYNVVLEKYEKLANEQNLSAASRALIDPLTKNTTIDELFGFENRQEENKIAPKQFKPTTHEVYRLNINPKLKIVKRDIYNSLFGAGSTINGTKIADSYYNLASVPVGISAVTYTIKDSTLNVSDNRAFNLWFSFTSKYDTNKIIDDTVFKSYYVDGNYEFLNNYNSTTKKGYKIWCCDNQITLTINEQNYLLTVSGLTTNIWYGLTINIDNRQGKISLDLFKRNSNYTITMFTNNYENVTVYPDELNYYLSRGYKPVKNTEIASEMENTNLLNLSSIVYENITPNSFNIDQTITVYASDMKLTNIRVFNDVIPTVAKSNILLQRIISDANYLIFADNATRQLYTENVKNTRWE